MDEKAYLSLQTKRKLLRGLYETVSSQAKARKWDTMLQWCEQNFDYAVRSTIVGVLNTLRNEINDTRRTARPKPSEPWVDTLKVEQGNLFQATKPLHENIQFVSHRIAGKLSDFSIRSRCAGTRKRKPTYEVDLVLSVGWTKTVAPLYELGMPGFGQDRFVLQAKPISSSNGVNYFQVSTASPVFNKDNQGWKGTKARSEYLVVEPYTKLFGFGETLLDARAAFERRTRNKVRLTLLDAKKNPDA